MFNRRQLTQLILLAPIAVRAAVPKAPVLGSIDNVPLKATSIQPLSGSYAPRAPASGDLYLDWTLASDGAGTAASPFNTLTAARVQSLRAGQSLFVKGIGPWPDTTGAASGTASSRIQVATWPGIAGGFTFSDPGQRLGGGSYWDLNGLTLACVNTGLCLAQNQAFGGGNISYYCRIINCIGTRSSNSFTDNSAIIFATDGCYNTEVVGGSYTGVAGSVNNQSLLWFDYIQNVNILGVLLDTCANPFYFKHTNVNSSSTPGGVVKNCIIRNAGRYCGAALNYVQYINNAFDKASLGMDESGGGLTGGNNCILSHNSFLNCDYLGAAQDATLRSNNVLTNNANLGTARLLDNPYNSSNGNNIADYTANDGAGVVHYYRNHTQYTMANYKAAYSGEEVHGVAGSIVLVGGTAPGATPSNWAMASGVGKSAASDGTDCGVNAANLLTVN